MKSKHIFSTVVALFLFCALTVFTLSGCNLQLDGSGIGSGGTDGGGTNTQTKTEYTVSYNSDGGSAVTSQKVSEGSLATVPASPTKSGYVFGGWYNGNKLWVFAEDTVSANITLKAKWIATSSQKVVTYDTDGGSIVPSALIPSNGKILPPEEPAKEGYTFIGWYNGQTPWVFVSSVANSDITLTAKWQLIDYTVEYELGEGAVNAEENPTTYTMLDEAITLAAPSRDGFIFTGWTFGEVSTPVLNPTIAGGATGNLSFTANWEEEPEFATYTIEYILGGGVNAAENPATYTEGGELITLVAPTREHYRFIGWTWDGNATPTMAVDVDPAIESGNKSFTANWEALTYTIKYVLSGGAHLGNPNTYTAADLPIALNPASKSETYFAGWYLDADFTVALDTIRTADNITLYARFIEGSDGIAYTLNATGDGYVVSGYTGTDNHVYISYLYEDMPIVEIADRAFANTGITGVTIPDSVKRIGEGAFGGCVSLRNIAMPASIEYLGADAFKNCDLSSSYILEDGIYYLGSSSNPYTVAMGTATTDTSITLNANTKIVYSGAFENTKNVTELTLPDGLTMLCDSALKGLDRITSLTLPSSLKYVGKSAFSYCINLKYYKEGGVGYLGNEDNPYLVLCEVDKALTALEIKADTKIICAYAFYGNKAIKVTYEGDKGSIYIDAKGNDVLFA